MHNHEEPNLSTRYDGDYLSAMVLAAKGMLVGGMAPFRDTLSPPVVLSRRA